MNETFEVGEIAVLLIPSGGPERHPWQSTIPNRSEVEIIAPLQRYANAIWGVEQTGPISLYKIRDQDGHEWGVPPSWLRKRKHPEQKREQLGEWELCPWRPTQVTERA